MKTNFNLNKKPIRFHFASPDISLQNNTFETSHTIKSSKLTNNNNCFSLFPLKHLNNRNKNNEINPIKKPNLSLTDENVINSNNQDFNTFKTKKNLI